jgi:hypothetical protein
VLRERTKTERGVRQGSVDRVTLDFLREQHNDRDGTKARPRDKTGQGPIRLQRRPPGRHSPSTPDHDSSLYPPSQPFGWQGVLRISHGRSMLTPERDRPDSFSSNGKRNEWYVSHVN